MSRFESVEHLLTHVTRVDHSLAHELATGGGLRGILDLHTAEAAHTTLEQKIVLLRRLQSIGIRTLDVAEAVIEIVQKHGHSKANAGIAVFEGLAQVADRAIYAQKDAPVKQKPRLGVAVFGTNSQTHLLLGRRGKQPNYGKLVIPGGGVEWGETLEDAARRELKEETGLEVDLFVPEQAFVHEVVEPDEHRVIVVLRARLLPGEPKASSDLLDAAYYPSDKIPFDEVSDVVKPILRRFGWVLN